MRSALLIATDTFADPTISRLRAPRQDATELAGLLGDPEVGGYQVEVLDNAPSDRVRRRIDDLFAEADRDDLVLLYFSGHGIKAESGQLHLATTDTERDRLASTAVDAQFVRDRIDHSSSRTVVLWLDCCYGGAFPAGAMPKAAGTVDVVDQLTDGSGRGCSVMTASTHIQYAFERGDDHLRGEARPSVFTSAIIEGLRTGDADLNGDGVIDSAELYGYVYDRVKAISPSQTPTWHQQSTGTLVIASSRRGLSLHSGLPMEIRQNLLSSRPLFQRTAIEELVEMSRNGDAAQRALAADTLEQLRESTHLFLSDAVTKAMAPPPSKPVAELEVGKPVGLPRVERPPAPPRPERRLRLPSRRIVAWSVAVERALAPGFAATVALMILLARQETRPAWLAPYVVAGLAMVAIAALGLLAVNFYRVFLTSSVTLATRVEGRAVRFMPNGRYLIAGGFGRLAWDTVRWEERSSQHSWAGQTWPPGLWFSDSVAFSPDGRLLAVGNEDDAQIWRLRHSLVLEWPEYLSSHEPIVDLAFGPSGVLVTVDWHGQVEVWSSGNPPSIRRWPVAPLPRDEDPVRAVAFSPDGRVLAAAGARRTRLWSTDDWTLIEALGEDSVAVEFSRDGELLAVAGDKSVGVWMTETWTRTSTIRLRGPGVMAFNTAGDLLAIGRGSGIVLVDPISGRVVRRLTGHHRTVTSVSFSPDDALLASTGRDQTVKLWELSVDPRIG